MRKIILLSVLALSACGPSAVQLAAQDDAKCRNYGFHKSSDGYATCRMLESNRRDDRRREAIRDMANSFNQNRTINCTHVGNSSFCNSY